MEVTFHHKNLSKKEEGQFFDYVNEKLDAISVLLTKFPRDAQMLKASIEKFNKHDAYQVEFTLCLPTKTIKSKEVSHQITKATDLAKDRMVAQVKKHMAHLRKDRVHKTIRDEAVITETQKKEDFIEV